MNKLTKIWYNPLEIKEAKELIKWWAVQFEMELIQKAREALMKNWDLGTDTLIDFYVDTMNNAMMTNKFWEKEADIKSRMWAADKLLKIMSWGLGNSKWQVTINVQNNNLWWAKIPSKTENLIY